MDKSRLHTLLTKYRDNTCTKEEMQELEQWFDSLKTDNQPIEKTDAFVNEMLVQFKQKLVPETKAIPFYRKTIFRVAAAAAIIILIGLTITLNLLNNKHTDKPAVAQTPDITAPNSTKAYITLSGGRKIYVDDLKNGAVAQEGNMAISKQDDKIIYTGSGLPTPDSRLNTITVPKGSKPLKLLLADGSEVWLDAATTVTYPNTFVGKERNVEIITGQAYFEVAHEFIRGTNEKMPFKVKKGNSEVEVLGTHFNVSAFDNENMKVTLLEGSVKLSELTTHDSRFIKPGQQIEVTPDSRLTTRNSVDLDEVMAWKNGNFQFEGADINEVMKQLARWYDVDVEIKGNISDHFGGTISRDVNVSEVFHMLQLTGTVNYKIEGRKIIVTP